MIKSFFYTLKQSLLQLARNKTMALTSLFSITAMLLILGMFFILAVNVNLMTQNMEQQFDMVEIYLLDETPEPVSYTHLDVYKRQKSSRVFFRLR